MSTSKQRKVAKLREQHGEDYTLYVFRWRKRKGVRVGGHIGSVPAPNLKTAVKRLIQNHKNMRYEWQTRVLIGLLKNKKFKKYVAWDIVELEKPTYYMPVDPP